MELSFRRYRSKDRKPSSHRGVPLAMVFSAVLVVLIAGLVVFDVPAIDRAKHLFSFYFLGQPPHFYLIGGEKNGREFTLKPGDRFLVSYNDEFVFTRISTDSLSGEGITVTVDGVEEPNIIGKTIRGKPIVDIAMSRLSVPREGQMETDLCIRIRYRGKEIATIPIAIIITPQDLLRFAEETNNFAQRIAYLEKLLSMRRETQVRRMLADAYLRAGHYRAAIEQFTLVLNERPHDIVALSGLAKCYREMGDYARLAEVYREMIRVNPRDGTLYVFLGDVLGRMGKWGQATESLREAVRLFPQKPEIRVKYAEALSHLGRYGEAIAEYQQAVNLDPKSIPLRALLAEAKMKAKDYDGAINEYQAMIKIAPRNAAVFANLAKAYGALRDYAREVENYRKAVSLDPQNPTLHYNLGVALERAGRWTEAKMAYRRVLELSPGDMEALIRLAEGESRVKNYPQAARYYEQILKKRPANAQIYMDAAIVYEQLRQLPRAIRLYEIALQKGAKDEHLYYHLFELYDKMGRKKEAVNTLERWIRVHPQAKAMNTLADYYLRQKRYEDAIRIGKQIVSRFPKQAQSYVGLARAYGLMGKTDEEIACLREALKYEREDDTIYFALGQAYEKKGIYEEALKAYKTAFELNPNSPASQKIRPLRVKVIEMKLKKNDASESK